MQQQLPIASCSAPQLPRAQGSCALECSRYSDQLGTVAVSTHPLPQVLLLELSNVPESMLSREAWSTALSVAESALERVRYQRPASPH